MNKKQERLLWILKGLLRQSLIGQVYLALGFMI